MNKNNNASRTMAWPDTRNGEGEDPFAGAADTLMQGCTPQTRAREDDEAGMGVTGGTRDQLETTGEDGDCAPSHKGGGHVVLSLASGGHGGGGGTSPSDQGAPERTEAVARDDGW